MANNDLNSTWLINKLKNLFIVHLQLSYAWIIDNQIQDKNNSCLIIAYCKQD